MFAMNDKVKIMVGYNRGVKGIVIDESNGFVTVKVGRDSVVYQAQEVKLTK